MEPKLIEALRVSITPVTIARIQICTGNKKNRSRVNLGWNVANANKIPASKSIPGGKRLTTVYVVPLGFTPNKPRGCILKKMLEIMHVSQPAKKYKVVLNTPKRASIPSLNCIIINAANIANIAMNEPSEPLNCPTGTKIKEKTLQYSPSRIAGQLNSMSLTALGFKNVKPTIPS